MKTVFSPLLTRCLILAGMVSSLSYLSGCASTVSGTSLGLLPADVILIGEQHDIEEHHTLELQIIELMIDRNNLQALVLEMVDRGLSTHHLPPDALPDKVRAALQWNDLAWPWKHYGPVVMAAVQAGIPVIGGNLEASQNRDSLQDASLDLRLSEAALQKQKNIIREGHCNMLAPEQLLPMARIQIARDLAMARTLVKTRQPDERRALVLIAGGWHIRHDLGIPAHLPKDWIIRSLLLQANAPKTDEQAAQQEQVNAIIATTSSQGPNYCERLRQTLEEKGQNLELLPR